MRPRHVRPIASGALLALVAGCGPFATETTGGTGGASTTTLHPDASPLPGESACTVVERTGIPEPDFNHLPICTPITYATNPPSGGNHWPIWAAYTEYTTPVPRELYVHDMEHGGVVLLYKCEGACPTVVAALSAAFEAVSDPTCADPPKARMVLTPDPLLDTPIAAGAWGATYTATCIDPPSLAAFITAHYRHGREDFCTDGVDVEGVTSSCAGGGG
jgi:hypothetical protein